MALRQFSHLAFDPWQLQCSSRVGDSDAIPLLRPLANDDILLFTSANSSSVNGSTSGSNTSDAELELDVDALAVMLDSPAAKRRRKRTYDTRKDEIDSLSKAAARLGAKLDFLKHRAGVQDAHSVAQKERCNATLREVLRTQQLQLAGVRSMMSVDPSYHALSPVSTRIHLERDLAQRRRALRAIKFQKLHDARRFLEKRTQFSRHTARLSESMRFETGDGEACVVKFDIVPLHSATSVKHAFDAVMFYFANLEICSTEALGDVTVREENVESGSSSRGCGTDDARGGGGGGITQHRFMRHHRHHDAIQIETNNVVFSEHTPSHRCAQTGECREEAIVVTDFVDQDDLYPYRPRERIRKDITSILHMRSFATRPRTSTANVSTSAASESNRRVNADDVGGPESACEQVVVLTMWYQATLRRGECAVPPEREREIIEDTDRVFKATLSSVRSLLRPTY